MDPSIVSRVTSGFTSLVRSFSRTPFAFLSVTLIAILIALLGLGGYLVATGQTDKIPYLGQAPAAVETVTPPPVPPAEEARRFQEGIPRDQLTCPAIDELAKRFDADRATFWIFKNGTYDLGGSAHSYSRVQCPYVKPGIAFIPEDFTEIPNTMNVETNAVLFPNYETTECGFWTVDDIKNPYVQGSMRTLGTSEMLQCGVRNTSADRVPIGKIVLSWRSHDPSRDVRAIQKAVKEAAVIIGRVNTPRSVAGAGSDK